MVTNNTEDPIPERIAALLNPIPGDSSSGSEATSSEEFFKLDMEIGKVSPDYKTCIDLASDILTGISKNLRVASWMCLAWYRTEGLPGLRDGLRLLLEMLKAFAADLFPQKPAHRSKALQFVDTSRFVKLVEREPIDNKNATIVIEIEDLLKALAAEGAKQFPDDVPDFKDLGNVMAEHAEEAKSLLQKASKATAPAAPPEDQDMVAPAESPYPVEKPVKKPAQTSAVTAQDMALRSEKDILNAFMNVLRSFLKLEEEDRKYHAYILGISRSLVWTKMGIPPHENSVTHIKAPDSAIINTLQKWQAEKNWAKLIPAIELNFLDEDSGFKYWLTAQRYVAMAMEQLGGPAQGAAEEILFQTARLLYRFPGLSQLKFENKLAFADDDTLVWIEEQVASRMGSGSGKDTLLPPILGEDYEPITEEYKKACSELPENFEKNVEALENGLAGETRRKGRFLRKLNLANFCFQAKKIELAKVHLMQLLTRLMPTI